MSFFIGDGNSASDDNFLGRPAREIIYSLVAARHVILEQLETYWKCDDNYVTY